MLTNLFVDMVRISEEMRQHVVVEMGKGRSQRDVARELNICQPTVRKIWKRFLDTGSTNDKAKCGRPMKASERERRAICRISNKKPFSTAREIYEEAGGPPMLSISTVQRYLRKSGLSSIWNFYFLFN